MEVKIDVKPRLINANALMEYCRNQKDKTVDCNDIARFPTYPTQETEKDVIINFLKKELIKKTYCRQVMKRQYRELKQKYDALLKKSNPVDTRFNDFVNGVRFGRFIKGGENGEEESHNED